MGEFEKCPLLAQDIDELLNMERLCFPTPWSRSDFEHEVQNPAAYYVVLKREGRIAAYGGMWLLPFAGHITNIAVHPDFRRRGLGKALVRELLGKARELSFALVYLEVREHNEIAQKLYRQFGFRFAGVEKDYYPDSHEDAKIMVCEISAQVPKITLRKTEDGEKAEYAVLCENVQVGSIRLNPEGMACRIVHFEIEKEVRRSGLGFAAMQKVAEYASQVLGAQKLILSVPEENRDAAAFFEACGFEKKAENQGLFQMEYSL